MNKFTSNTLILFSASALILSGCASTNMDTAFVKQDDGEIVAIEDSTIEEENMSLITLEEQETTEIETVATAPETTPIDEIIAQQEATDVELVVTTGNPDAYVEINAIEDTSTPTEVSVIEGGNSLHSLEQEVTNEPVEQEIVAEKDTTDILEEAVTPPPSFRMVLFATNSAELEPEVISKIADHAIYLIENPDARLVIQGHADNRGSADYNQKLSEKRAQAVADLLVELGAMENQLAVESLGDTQPVVDPSNWDANRRVEMQYQSPTILTSR